MSTSKYVHSLNCNHVKPCWRKLDMRHHTKIMIPQKAADIVFVCVCVWFPRRLQLDQKKSCGNEERSTLIYRKCVKGNIHSLEKKHLLLWRQRSSQKRVKTDTPWDITITYHKFIVKINKMNIKWAKSDSKCSTKAVLCMLETATNVASKMNNLCFLLFSCRQRKKCLPLK